MFSHLCRYWARLCASLFFALASVFATQLPAADPIDLRVATFNLRFASEQKPNSWPERRPVIRACIKKLDADVIGTQEGLFPQLKDVAADSPDSTGSSRDLR